MHSPGSVGQVYSLYTIGNRYLLFYNSTDGGASVARETRYFPYAFGYTKELPLERIYRDARVTRIYDGTSEIHRMLIARSVIKNGLSI